MNAPEAHSELSQRSKMKVFRKTVNDWKPLAILEKVLSQACIMSLNTPLHNFWVNMLHDNRNESVTDCGILQSTLGFALDNIQGYGQWTWPRKNQKSSCTDTLLTLNCHKICQAKMDYKVRDNKCKYQKQ